MAVTVKLTAPTQRSATSYYAWPLPTPRGDKDIWGDILNTQTFAGIDAALHNNNPATTGSIDNMVIGGVTPRAATFASMVLNAPLPLASGGTGATDAAGARASLGVSATGADATYATKAANLSDMANIATARSNLGVSASGADTAYAWRANNLSDVNATTARTNLGLGTAAVKNTGTSGNTVPLLDGANTFSGASTVFNGNVGIGMTPTHLLDVRKDQNATTMLEVANADPGTAARAVLQVANGLYSGGIYAFGVNYSGSGIFAGNSALFYSNAPTQVTLATGGAPLVFGTNNTERARITADGFFKASDTGVYPSGGLDRFEFASSNASFIAQLTNSSASPHGLYETFSAASPNNTGNTFLYCSDSSATRAQIYANGGIANYQSNNVNLSDAELKADITPYNDKDLDALETSFRAVNWCKFKYRDQSHDDWNHGYLAQDIAKAFAATAPELVDETTVGVPTKAAEGTARKAVYDSDLTHIGMALLARALARIDELEHLVHDKKRHHKK